MILDRKFRKKIPARNSRGGSPEWKGVAIPQSPAQAPRGVLAVAKIAFSDLPG
jgi:hypothetical protein